MKENNELLSLSNMASLIITESVKLSNLDAGFPKNIQNNSLYLPSDVKTSLDIFALSNIELTGIK